MIAGDGIGPELTRAAVSVMETALRLHGTGLEFVHEDAGADTFRRTGQAMAPGALDRIRGYDALLKGPVGDPAVRHPDGTEAGLLGGLLREGLDTYANVRPIRLLPGIRGATRYEAGEIDHVIVRENTEGLYMSRGRGVRNARAASDQLMMTREGVERIAHAAFVLARRRTGAPADGVSRVTCVDKSNVLRSFGFFRDVFDEVAQDYPDVEADHMYADAAGCALVAEPSRFDVLVMENLLGDVLSDVGAGTVGGLGMCPSGNIGDTAAYFEPIHGSAPGIAGSDRANPFSQILAGALLLDHIGHTSAARSVEDAVSRVLAHGTVTVTTSGSPDLGTRAAAEAVVEALAPPKVSTGPA